MTRSYLVDLDKAVKQAQERAGLPAARRPVEEELWEARERLQQDFRAEGRYAVCRGYATRKTLQTPVGDPGPLRIPRRRVDGEEVRLLARTTGPSLSAATVGRIAAGPGASVEARRQAPLRAGESVAVVTDAVWGRDRGAGDAALRVAMGVRSDGSFEVLDWEPDVAESTEAYPRLLTRLWERGLREPERIVGDGAAAIPSAREWVYPSAAFRRRWRRAGQDAVVAAVDQRFAETLGFLSFPEAWRHRLRTVNLAEGLFRDLRRLLCRWPGFQDPAHLAHVLGLYWLSTQPERIGSWRHRAA